MCNSYKFTISTYYSYNIMHCRINSLTLAYNTQEKIEELIKLTIQKHSLHRKYACSAAEWEHAFSLDK